MVLVITESVSITDTVRYLDYFCTKYEDPDFKVLFKEMGAAVRV